MRLVLALLLTLSPLAAETYLVCAGVETYDDAGISALKYAVADVKAVAAAFRDAGVPESNITLLTSDAAERRSLPTKASLLRALQSARSQAREDDTILFFFSGHGMERGGEPYLLTFDSNAELLDQTALSMTVINQALQGFQGANLLLVIDACRNDPDAGKAAANAVLDESFAKGLRPRLQPRAAGAREPNVALLLACEVGQRAWEMPEQEQGAFTYWLLQGLRSEAPRTADGVALDGLAGYLAREVPAWAKRAGREQTPRFEQVSGGDFLLPAPRQRPAPDVGPTTPAEPGGPQVGIVRREGTLEITTRLPQVRIEIDGQPAGEVTVGRPVRLTRLIGRVTVRGAAAGYVPLEQTVEVKLNQTTTVALDMPKLPGLTVETDLPGVTVEIDGMARGEAGPEAPVSAKELTVGEHRVRVTLPGRAPAEQTVTLTAGRVETVKLTPLAFPTLTIEVEEEGVEVLLDGQPVGTLGPATPAMVRNVTPGEHKLTARKGVEERSTTVTLAPGTEQSATAWSAVPVVEYLKDFKPLPGLQYRIAPKDGMPQVLIPAGEFLMGSPADEPDRQRNEGPQKQVYVSAFWMDLHEVTVGQYQRFCQATGRTMDTEYNEDDSHPVVMVSWDDAAAYAKWARRQLPTEAQWEKAARGGTTTAYPWGDTFDSAKASNENGPKPVGSYAPNGFGLYDMAGSVSEWCRDWYYEYWYIRMPARDPVNETKEIYRVSRGGTWIRIPGLQRVALRGRSVPDLRHGSIGFRCSETAIAVAPGAERETSASIDSSPAAPESEVRVQIQLSQITDKRRAEEAVSRLQSAGYGGSLRQTSGGLGYWVVYTRVFTSRKEANVALSKIRSMGYDAWFR